MTQSRRLVVVMSLSLPLALGACGHDREASSPDHAAEAGPSQGLTPASGALPSGPGQPANTEPAAPADEHGDRLTDQQIVAVAAAVNAAEVDQAKIAVGRAKKKAVKEFAQMMIAHHGKAVKDVNELSTRLNLTPADSELVTHLRVDATETLTKLEQEEANDFDEEYIEAQISMHETALKKLDERLLPNVRNEELKTLLQTMRAQVAQHLEQARALDAKL